MKISFVAILTLFLPLYAGAQNTLAQDLSYLYDQKKYDEVIKHKPRKGQDVTAKALYYKGMAYYMKEDDKNAMKYIDMALAKGPVDYDMFYYKGMLLFYAEAYTESLPFFDKAISLLPNEPDFCAGKAEAYYMLDDKQSALEYFQRASRLPNCKPRALFMLAQTYNDLNKKEHALNAYKVAITRFLSTEEEHQTCSYNIGLLQQLLGKAAECKATFEKHVADYPLDYRAIAKLVQAYYSLSEFDNAKPYKKRLYAACKMNMLPEEMKKIFCIDQFVHKGKRVMVFESFDEPGDMLVSKIHFHVMANEQDIEYTVNLEADPIRKLLTPKTYVLCVEKNDQHLSQLQYTFDNDYNYSEVRDAVLEVINKQ